MFNIVEIFWQIGFGLWTTPKTGEYSKSSLRSRFMASASYACIDVAQSHDVANVQCSINNVSEEVQPFEYYALKNRQTDYAHRHDGEIRPQELEDNYQEKTAALQEVGEWSYCPVEHCDAVIHARNRTWNKRLRQWICLVCNGRDGRPLKNPELGLVPRVSQKRKGTVPDTCSVSWCTVKYKERNRSENDISKKKKASGAANIKHNLKWREEIGWICEICDRQPLDDLLEDRPLMPATCMECGKAQSRRWWWESSVRKWICHKCSYKYRSH